MTLQVEPVVPPAADDSIKAFEHAPWPPARWWITQGCPVHERSDLLSIWNNRAFFGRNEEDGTRATSEAR